MVWIHVPRTGQTYSEVEWKSRPELDKARDMKWVQDPKTGKLVEASQWYAQVDWREQKPTVTVVGDIGDFQNPQGKHLHGRKQLRDDLNRQNCHIYERGEREYIDRMRAQHEQAEQRALHRTIAEIAAERGIGIPD